MPAGEFLAFRIVGSGYIDPPATPSGVVAARAEVPYWLDAQTRLLLKEEWRTQPAVAGGTLEGHTRELVTWRRAG